MDSSGIGLVMGRYKLMSEKNGKVSVLNPTPPIRKVMMISGIGKLAKIVNTDNRLFENENKKEAVKNEAVEEKSDKQDEGAVSGSVPE